MSKEPLKDIIVVARPGYQVLLNIGSNNYQVDSYSPINLSALYTREILDKCASLRAHLEDGNLIYYKENMDLPKDPFAKNVDTMKETAATKLEAEYTQKTETNAVNVRVQTTADINNTTKDQMQERIQKSKEDILNKDRSLLEKRKRAQKNVVSAESRKPKERQEAMKADELQLNVQMDISPEKFKQQQAANRKKLADKELEEHQTAMSQIIEAENEDNQ